MRPFDEVLLDEGMCLLLSPLEDELSHLLQMGFRLRTIVVVRGPTPKGLFISLGFFGRDTAIDHRTQL